MADEMAPDGNADLRARVVALEQWRMAKDVESARHDERWTALEDRLETRFRGFESQITKVNDSLTWITRLIIGGIVLAIIGFLIKGGFAP